MSKSMVVSFLSDPIQYQPGQKKNRETSKLIRIHVAETIRQQKHSKLLTPQKLKERLPNDGQFCNCSVLRPASEPVETPVSRARQKQRVIADTYKICQVCKRKQFTELSWPGQLKVVKAVLPSVAAFMEAEFDPFDSLPELEFYKGSPAATRTMNEFKAHMVQFWSYDALRSHVLPSAAKEPALYMGLLYSSCSHLNAMRGWGQTRLSMAIKAEAMRQINLRLSDPTKRNTSVTIASIAYLSDGVWTYDGANRLEECDAHEDGMIGILTQGMNFIIPKGDLVGETLLNCLALHQFIRAAVLSLPLDLTWVAIFCQSTRIINNDEYLPESPLYCPRDDFYSIIKSPKCSKETLEVIRGARYIIEHTSKPEPTVDDFIEYENTRLSLLTMPPLSPTAPGSKESGDYIYESCRLTALITLQALDEHKPFIEVTEQLSEELKCALQRTDIGSYWGLLRGVLFWIALTGSAAAVGKKQHAFMNSIVCRGGHDLVYRNSIFEGATLAAYTLQQVHMGLKLAGSEAWLSDQGSMSPDAGIISEEPSPRSV